MRIQFPFAVVAAMITGMMLGCVGPALAQPISITACPYTIASSDHYLLKSDCSIGSGGIGITIVVSNVRLTMGGRTLTGPSDGTGIGVLVMDGASGVAITGGTVTGFGNGVKLDGVSGSRLDGLVVSNNIAPAPNGNGILLHGSSTNVLAGITSSGNRTGFRIKNESNDNTLSANLASASLGTGFLVRADASHSTSGNALLNNVATGNTTGIAIGGAASTGSTTDTTVKAMTPARTARGFR